MSAGPQGRLFRLGRDLETVLDEPGWYRGDLHLAGAQQNSTSVPVKIPAAAG
jgi:hypothetical protein